MPKRTAAQREEDFVEISDLYLRGETLRSIAARVGARYTGGLSAMQIQRDLKTVYAKWKEKYADNFNDQVARELARVDKLEVEYWRAYDRSCGAREITGQTNEERPPATAGGAAVRTATKRFARRELRDGNIAWLHGVQWCHERRCRILGLEAPQEFKASVTPGRITMEDLIMLARDPAGYGQLPAAGDPRMYGPPPEGYEPGAGNEPAGE